MIGINAVRIALALLAPVVLPAQAAATERVSGTITRTFMITEDTELAGDVTCDVGSNPCFAFAAPGVELKLNGFSVTGKADALTGCGGASFAGESGISTNGQPRVTVRGPGLVQRFRLHGVAVVNSIDARVELITASTNCGAGIFVAATSFGTLVQNNVAVRNGSTQPGFSCGGI
jgi:hypothetical protein